MTKSIACYLRVSTDNQKHDSQRQVLRMWLKGQRLKTDSVRWYCDKISGTTSDRPQLSKLLRAVEKGDVTTVAMTRLDRLSRRTRQGLETLATLADHQCRVVATEQNIDFAGPMGQFCSALFLALSEFERETTVARINEGLAAWRESNPGKSLGRPRNQKKLDQIQCLRGKGMPVTQIATKLGCSKQNIYNALKKMD